MKYQIDSRNRKNWQSWRFLPKSWACFVDNNVTESLRFSSYTQGGETRFGKLRPGFFFARFLASIYFSQSKAPLDRIHLLNRFWASSIKPDLRIGHISGQASKNNLKSLAYTSIPLLACDLLRLSHSSLHQFSCIYYENWKRRFIGVRFPPLYFHPVASIVAHFCLTDGDLQYFDGVFTGSSSVDTFFRALPPHFCIVFPVSSRHGA